MVVVERPAGEQPPRTTKPEPIPTRFRITWISVNAWSPALAMRLLGSGADGGHIASLPQRRGRIASTGGRALEEQLALRSVPGE
jgi:hypothetical protein